MISYMILSNFHDIIYDIGQHSDIIYDIILLYIKDIICHIAYIHNDDIIHGIFFFANDIIYYIFDIL